jgi:uncharacterized protein YyaL (SSP411 family)
MSMLVHFPIKKLSSKEGAPKQEPGKIRFVRVIMNVARNRATAAGGHYLAAQILGIAGFFLFPVHSSAQEMADSNVVALERQWGEEVLAQIDTDFWLPDRQLYADKATLEDGDPSRRQPAFMWGCGVQLSALAEAAKANPQAHSARLCAYADALQVYWQNDNLGGYDCLPCPKPPDRYYDDNAWIVLALAKTFEVTGQAKYLQRAEDTMKFVLSGEDDKLGGGLYWRERSRETKNTCSNAPATVGALRLYRLTGELTYLDTANRLYTWTQSHLQDTDGLYWDSISVTGKIAKQKFSYNTALMIRAACLFYEVTHDENYLNEARRMGNAALDKWVGPDGSVHDSGCFAHLLLGSFLALNNDDSDPKWLDAADRIVHFVHEQLRDPNGRYPGRWDSPPSAPLEKFGLLQEASVANAYWETSNVYRKK